MISFLDKRSINVVISATCVARALRLRKAGRTESEYYFYKIPERVEGD